jgi:hypothetical protein
MKTKNIGFGAAVLRSTPTCDLSSWGQRGIGLHQGYRIAAGDVDGFREGWFFMIRRLQMAGYGVSNMRLFPNPQLPL